VTSLDLRKLQAAHGPAPQCLLGCSSMPERLRVQLVSEDPRSQEIAELYWSQDDEGQFVYRVAEIAETYDISSREVQEVACRAAVAESESRQCGHCGLGRRFRSRHEASTTGSYLQGGFICDECSIQEAAERREAERRLIAEHYSVPDDYRFDCANLSLEEAVGLYSLIRQCADEDHSRLLPVRTASQTIGPHEYVFDLLRMLHENLLWVDPDSDSDAFVWENGAPDRFYLDAVRWRVPGEPGELARIAQELRRIFEEKDWPEHWEDEAPHLQRRIAAHELADYLVARLAEHHFQWSPGEKTWEILNAMARSRSIGEGYNLIWRAARDAAAFYVREGCSAKRAAGYAITVLRRSFENAEAQGWNLKAFSRDWNLPRSEVTHVFYELYLGVANEMTFPPLPIADRPIP
ncbi:MAG TPA: hypothetical protein VIL21_02840, partial [Solirubrobacterales bacterium]